MRRVFTWPRAIFLLVAGIAFAAWWVPKLSAEKYREPIRQALESALGRKVKISAVEFRLLPVPGFTVTNVIIGEDPVIGSEPMAYVTVLHARPTVASLLGGSLAFASVDLEDASLNLTRVDRGGEDVRWNFAALMNPKLLATFPAIHMTDGRVNFKLEDTKSVFYLLHTDVDVWPPNAADGPWTLKIRAEPARTDRPSRGFAAFTARGQWAPRERTITLDAKLEKSELGDIVTLFEGYESNIQGHISGSAHVAGPLNRLGVAGRIAVDEIHGWNQTPPGGGAWPFTISGAINLPGQDIQLRAVVAGSQPSPLDVRYRVSGYLVRPRWGANALFTRLPIAPLVGMARNLGLAVPADMTLEGTADGAVGYSYADGNPRMDGAVRIANPTLRFTGAPSLKVPQVDLLFAGTHVSMPSAVVTNDAGESATLQGDVDVATRDVQATVSSEGMSIVSLRRQFGAASIPLLGQATAGMWSGRLENATGKDGWAGEVHLRDAVLPFEAFNEPLHVASADAVLDGANFELTRVAFSLGTLEGQGEYRYESASPRPHRFRAVFARADAAAIEQLLMPTLHRGTFLNYAFNFGRVPEPGWMQAMHADGTLQFGELTIAGKVFTKVKSRALWDGSDVHLAQLEGVYGIAAFAGVADVTLAQRQPGYVVSGKISSLAWHGGLVAVEGTLHSAGTGNDLLTNMTAKGALRGRSVEVGPGAAWDAIQGCFDWDLRNSRLQLTQMVMTRAHQTYSATAEMKKAGQVDLQIANGKEQIQTVVQLTIP